MGIGSSSRYVRDVQIAAVNDRLFRVQPQQIRAQRVFPLHAVWKALEAVLRIGRINNAEQAGRGRVDDKYRAGDERGQ